MIDLAPYTGRAAFGAAYHVMLNNDTHAPGSVDHRLMDAAIRLNEATFAHLYSSFTSLAVCYRRGSRPSLEAIVERIAPRTFAPERRASAIVEFTSGLCERASIDLAGC